MQVYCFGLQGLMQIGSKIAKKMEKKSFPEHLQSKLEQNEDNTQIRNNDNISRMTCCFYLWRKGTYSRKLTASVYKKNLRRDSNPQSPA